MTNNLQHLNGGKNVEYEFNKLFDTLVKDLVENQSLKTKEVQEWYKKLLEYNVPNGKKNRGLTVIHSYQHLIGPSNDITDDEFLIAGVLGWCIEFLQAFFLISDDIMDRSITRRGKPCWYTLPGIELVAVNDTLYVESAIYQLLKKYLRHKSYYVDICDLFHDVTHKTIMGQSLDLLTSSPSKVNFDNFTIERYEAIVKYKTAYYSFYLPVACALYMAGINDEASHNVSKEILLKMGEYFQIQDDYLDCFGDPEVTGKIGTDIEDNKCSWLIVQALQRSSSEERDILQLNYGKPDERSVETVKKIYESLNLRTLYQDYEYSSFQEINRIIDNNDTDKLPKELFRDFVRKIYKRKK